MLHRGRKPPGGRATPRHATPRPLGSLGSLLTPDPSQASAVFHCSSPFALRARHGTVEYGTSLYSTRAARGGRRAVPLTLTVLCTSRLAAPRRRHRRPGMQREPMQASHRIATQPASRTPPAFGLHRKAGTRHGGAKARSMENTHTHGRCACPGRIAKESGSRGQ